MHFLEVIQHMYFVIMMLLYNLNQMVFKYQEEVDLNMIK